EAGFPPGVFNLVQGDGAGVGSMLTAHEDVDMISFTGSTRAGRIISKTAAETLKRVHLELGGKGANLIFADADEKAVKRGV
nr:aldehyde dehydrogenase family protein [Desulfuromonadales bacterium]